MSPRGWIVTLGKKWSRVGLVIRKCLNVVAKGANYLLSVNPREEVVESWPGLAKRTHSIVGRKAFKEGIVGHLLDSKVVQMLQSF